MQVTISHFKRGLIIAKDIGSGKSVGLSHFEVLSVLGRPLNNFGCTFGTKNIRVLIGLPGGARLQRVSNELPITHLLRIVFLSTCVWSRLAETEVTLEGCGVSLIGYRFGRGHIVVSMEVVSVL